MSTPSKPYVRSQPQTRDQLYEMLAQAVRNTQPELNRPTVPEPEPKPKRDRARASARTPASKPAKRSTKVPTKGKKDRTTR
jgi:hypothetical protein